MDELFPVKNIKNESFGIIYCVENLINGKKYVGQTIRPLRVRWLQHISDSKRLGFRGLRKFSRAIKKYGKNNFKVSIIDSGDNFDDLNEKEIFWIEKMNSFQKGYNSNKGGSGKGISEEVRKKISESSKNRVISEETRLKMIEAAKTKESNFKEGKQHPFSRAIYKLNPNDFSIIEEFESVSLAGKIFQNTKRGGIEYAAKHRGSSGGYFWVYKDEYNKIKNFENYFKNSKVFIQRRRKNKRDEIARNKINKKIIFQLDTNDFHIINKFSSIKHILKYLGKKESSDIIEEALRTKKEKEGFYWIKYEEYKKVNSLDNYFDKEKEKRTEKRKIKAIEIEKEKRIRADNKKILQLDINDFSIVDEYNANKDIVEKYNFEITCHAISKAISNKNQYKGYYWIRKGNFKKIKNIKTYFKIRSFPPQYLGTVNQLDENNDIIKEWINCATAEKFFNGKRGSNIYRAIQKNKKAFGFYWKLVN